MLTCVPQVDRDQFQESGDGNVYIPLHIMEKYMLPSLRIRGFMHDKTIEALPGGADTLMAYSLFSQGSVMPRFRTEHDLEVLRNTVFSAETFVAQQMRADKEVSEGLSAHLKATIRRLKKETTLPDYNHISDMNQDQLDERQAGIDMLIKLYTDQVTRDYNRFRLQKVLLSHLTQRQSIELLEVNLKLTQMIDLNRKGFQVSMDEEVIKTSEEMEKRMANMFEQHRKFFGFATAKLADKITPYYTNDMRKVLESQKEKLHDLLAKNALLVTENSELRMHLSFMPVEYRDFVRGFQNTNHESYRNQRSNPKVIIPDTGHLNNQFPIRLMNAPMAHPSVIAMFRDAQYETFFDLNKVYEKGFALRGRINENADTKRIPKTEAPWRQPGSIPLDKNLLLPPKGTMINPPRVPLDQRLVKPTAPRNAPVQKPTPRERQEPPPQTAPQGTDHGTGYFIDTKGGGGRQAPTIRNGQPLSANSQISGRWRHNPLAQDENNIGHENTSRWVKPIILHHSKCP
jgi:hypothetical protein